VALRQASERLEEFALIRALRGRFSHRDAEVIRGIGDDAAVIATSPKQWWHVTTDMLVEGVHFDLGTASPEAVGYRSAMANLSDLAAMGAVPRYLLTSIAIPRRCTAAHVEQLYGGLMKACRPHGVNLIGGDTSASRGGLFLSLTLIGITRSGQALLRSGARIGDALYVTGTLGDSLAGLQILTRRPSGRVAKPHQRFLIHRHLRPTARVSEGQWLSRARLASAAIDLSDGLSGDVRHLCEESRVGVDIELGAIPVSRACRAYAKASEQDPTQLALSGGEDYELLFTVSAHRQPAVEQQAKKAGYRITRIGVIRPRRSGLRMRSQTGEWHPLPLTSYEHFCE
jgi:thiamine-monophosphate kinase